MNDLIEKLVDEARGKAKKKDMPDWLDPMLAKLPMIISPVRRGYLNGNWMVNGSLPIFQMKGM